MRVERGGDRLPPWGFSEEGLTGLTWHYREKGFKAREGERRSAVAKRLGLLNRNTTAKNDPNSLRSWQRTPAGGSMSDLLCTICLGNAHSGSNAQGDRIHVICSRCGEYLISRTDAIIQKRQLDQHCAVLGDEGSRKRANASGFVRENRQMSLLLAEDFDKLAALPTPSFQSRAERLMLALEKETEFAGKEVEVDCRHWLGRTWCANDLEFDEVAHSLESEGYLNMLSAKGAVNAGQSERLLKIAPKGWGYLERLKERNPLSRQGFVAMWFHACMTPVYEEFIVPAIRDAGYEPDRIDRKEHYGRIDDAIIAEIRRSRFVVADFTGHRGGVYYEAGFAHGLKIPVVFTCRKKELHKLHFDVRQYVTIDWETPEELRKRLTAKITGAIGWGPLANKEPGETFLK